MTNDTTPPVATATERASWIIPMQSESGESILKRLKPPPNATGRIQGLYAKTEKWVPSLAALSDGPLICPSCEQPLSIDRKAYLRFVLNAGMVLYVQPPHIALMNAGDKYLDLYLVNGERYLVEGSVRQLLGYSPDTHLQVARGTAVLKSMIVAMFTHPATHQRVVVLKEPFPAVACSRRQWRNVESQLLILNLRDTDQVPENVLGHQWPEKRRSST